MRVRTGLIVESVENALKKVINNIRFIYVPHHAETKEEKLIITDKIYVAYSKTPK